MMLKDPTGKPTWVRKENVEIVRSALNREGMTEVQFLSGAVEAFNENPIDVATRAGILGEDA